MQLISNILFSMTFLIPTFKDCLAKTLFFLMITLSRTELKNSILRCEIIDFLSIVFIVFFINPMFKGRFWKKCCFSFHRPNVIWKLYHQADGIIRCEDITSLFTVLYRTFIFRNSRITLAKNTFFRIMTSSELDPLAAIALS